MPRSNGSGKCLLFRGVPKPFGLLHGSTSLRGADAPCLASPSGSLRLPNGRCQACALSPSGTPAALRSAFVASRALSVSLRNSGSLHASPRAQPLSPLGLRKPAGLCFAPALVLLRSFASPSGSASLCRWSCIAALGTLRFPREFCFVIPVPACAGTGSGGNPGAPYCRSLLSHEFRNPAASCHSRESRNPGNPVCLPLVFPQCGFAFNIYTSRRVSFRRSFAGVSKAKRRGISSRIRQ